MNSPVSTHCIGCPVMVFQNRMHRSAVPPPEANNPCWCGDHAIAFTAAKCDEYVWTGESECCVHTYSLLSLPPEARHCPSGDHFKPHTSCLCPIRVLSETKAKIILIQFVNLSKWVAAFDYEIFDYYQVFECRVA